MTKDEVLDILWQRAGDWVSGAELAEALSLSRTAVWKAVERLRGEGYRIDSAAGQGYRLCPENDVLSEKGIRKHLKNKALRLEVYPSVSSTNTLLAARAAAGEPEGLVLVAGEQSQGRGRMGRSFYSPPGTGIYMSALFRPEMDAVSAVNITACAAVAVAEAIEETAGVPAQIKWVNDVLVGGKKVCGILTEGAFSCESGRMSHVIVGIGINTRVPAGDFPPELQGVAGAVLGGKGLPELRCRLTAAVLDRLTVYYSHLLEKDYYTAYRERSLVLGKPISILSPGREPVPALALDIDRDFALLARLEDGRVVRLNSGEVSVREVK